MGNISAKELSRLQSGGGQPVVVDAGRVEVAPGPTDQGIQTSAVGEAGARAVQYVGGGARPAGAIGAEDRK